MTCKYLKIAAVSAAAAMTLSSCGNTVSIMSTPAEADTLDPDKTYVSELEVRSAYITDSIEEENEIYEEETTEAFETTTTDISNTDYELPSKSVIDGFETVMQIPELPTGCEITALAEVLNYIGFDIDKVELCDNYMPVDYDGYYSMNEAYIGNPKSESGFGCYAPVIMNVANRFFSENNSWCYAVDLTDTELTDLFYQIDQNRPVITWVTIDLREAYPNFKFVCGNGEEMWFDDYQHCLAIYGYDIDENIVYAADPLVGNIEYPLEKFEKIYNIMGKQAVVVCGTADDLYPDYLDMQDPVKSIEEIAEGPTTLVEKQMIEEASIAAEEASREAEEASRAAAEEEASKAAEKAQKTSEKAV